MVAKFVAFPLLCAALYAQDLKPVIDNERVTVWDHVKKLLENNRVVVWSYRWNPGEPTPMQ
jgi:hypothetical protein